MKYDPATHTVTTYYNNNAFDAVIRIAKEKYPKATRIIAIPTSMARRHPRKFSIEETQQKSYSNKTIKFRTE